MTQAYDAKAEAEWLEKRMWPGRPTEEKLADAEGFLSRAYAAGKKAGRKAGLLEGVEWLSAFPPEMRSHPMETVITKLRALAEEGA